MGIWQCVTLHRDCHVKFDHKLYSAPFTLVGKELWLRATDSCVSLFDDYRLVATHARGQRPGQRITTADHMPPKAQLFFAHDRQWLGAQALQIGPYCQQVIDWLLGDRILERLRAGSGCDWSGKDLRRPAS